MEFKHIPIMLDQVIENLDIKKDGIYVDLTCGGAGHSREIVKHLGKDGKLICVDQDMEALEVSKNRLEEFSEKVFFYNDNFEKVDEILDYYNIEKVDGFLLDIGVSSYQIDNKDRGFSFMTEARLDMRMNQASDLTAYDVINFYSREKLEYIFFTYGEEKWTKRIVDFILDFRKISPIQTTLELVDVIDRAIPKAVRKKEANPYKRVFQALRIEVNRELEVLKVTLPKCIDRLNFGGRLCVITFHSLEDRIVKEIFKDQSTGCNCPKDIPICVCGRKRKVKIITKKPLIADDDEIINNSRSKSAKLRVCSKI